jgi:hypothetical protein
MALTAEGDVTTDVGGETFAGRWKVVDDQITVTFADEVKTVHLASQPPPLTEVAKEILSDLVGIHLTKRLGKDPGPAS